MLSPATGAQDPLRPSAADLRREMTRYAEAAKRVDYSGYRFRKKCRAVESFWAGRLENCLFASWRKLAFELFLVQASSASAERAFSRLKLALRTASQGEDIARAAVRAVSNKPRDLAKESRQAVSDSDDDDKISDSDSDDDELVDDDEEEVVVLDDDDDEDE